MAPVLIAKVALENVSYHLIKHTITAFRRACGSVRGLAAASAFPLAGETRSGLVCFFPFLRKNRPVGSSSFPACWMKSLF